MSEVAALEEVCERAWPPRERVELDGAVLRFTDGFTRRANSARVDGGGGDLDGLIARAEHEYRSRGLRPGFRLTPLSPPAFERLLGERGYVVDTEAVVMVAEALPETAPARGRRRRSRCSPGSTRSGCASSRPSSATGRAEQDPGARWVLGSGAAPRRFALARVDGAPAATGYARLEDDWLYIACVGTVPRPPPARARARRQRAALRLGRAQRRTARHPAGRDEKRRGAGALCAARLPPALRLPRPRPGFAAALTNTPHKRLKDRTGGADAGSTGGPGGCRGYAEGPLVTCGEPYV